MSHTTEHSVPLKRSSPDTGVSKIEDALYLSRVRVLFHREKHKMDDIMDDMVWVSSKFKFTPTDWNTHFLLLLVFIIVQ